MEQTKFNKSFFDKVESVKIKDPLAIALGAMDKKRGICFYVYRCGKTCRSFMSGGFWRIQINPIGIKSLYGNETPARGQIRVTFKGG